MGLENPYMCKLKILYILIARKQTFVFNAKIMTDLKGNRKIYLAQGIQEEACITEESLLVCQFLNLLLHYFVYHR